MLEGRANLSECVFPSTFQRFVAQIKYSVLLQPSATSPLFFDNLPHWGENFDKHFNVDLWLTLLSKFSPQWGRLSKKRGLVADGCTTHDLERCLENAFGKVGPAFPNPRLGTQWGAYKHMPIHSRPPARSIACQRVFRRWLIRRVFSGDATNGGGCCACLTASTNRPMEVSAV